MYNCPEAGKWAMAVWQGTDEVATGEALATCGEGAVDAAYALDASSGAWLRWFPDRPEVSNLAMVERMQALFVLGSPTASPIPTVGLMPPESDQMWGCPLPGKWAMAVWEGADGAEAEEALDTCGVWQADVAYSLDPETGVWARWFRDRPEVSTLKALPFLGALVTGKTLGTSDLIAFTSTRDSNYEIYVMNADGTAQTRLTYKMTVDEYPAWSPDGSKIAFDSNRYGNYEILVMNANGTMQANLTKNPGADYLPTWSPTGSKIAFTSERDGNPEIYVMFANGTTQANLTHNPAQDLYPSWSPDGSKIAFESDRNGNWEIYVINAAGTGGTRLTNDPDYDRHPTWSPDGTKIAFTSHRDGNPEIYVMNADGTGQTRLTNNPAWDDDPAWSPDGTKIAFWSDRNGNGEIYVMNAAGTGGTRVTNNPALDYVPSWSP
jgi:Tol biopolymer transport system component